MVEKRGSSADAQTHRSGVYRIPCNDCDLPYYGRTTKKVNVRFREHQDTVVDKDDHSALVKHTRSHPGHEFSFSDANLIWKTRNLAEMRMVESACISNFPSCNVSEGEVKIGPMLSSIVIRTTCLQPHTVT